NHQKGKDQHGGQQELQKGCHIECVAMIREDSQKELKGCDEDHKGLFRNGEVEKIKMKETRSKLAVMTMCQPNSNLAPTCLVDTRQPIGAKVLPSFPLFLAGLFSIEISLSFLLCCCSRLVDLL